MSPARLLTDGGLETELIFGQGLDLPFFAAFPLLDDPVGRECLSRYYAPYIQAAADAGVGFAAGTPTWRANADWGARLGYGAGDLARVNADSIAFLRDLVGGRGVAEVVVGGCVGPRGDGYVASAQTSIDDARRYHAAQVEAFAGADADVVRAASMTHVAEAAGVVLAARDAGLPVVISFTVETDGRLPDGTGLGDAITAVDVLTDTAADYFMVNCAHPEHLQRGLRPGDEWLARVGGLRANASRLSHAELDEAGALESGDPDDFARSHMSLREVLPNVQVLGGCCGTDVRHVEAVVRAWGAPPA